jgi:glucose-1-phosphate thymidylyltransferase
VVEDSTLGPDVALAHGCTVISSTIEDSLEIVGCRIQDIRGLSGSILGRGVEVRSATREGKHRLVVGDQSQVEVD